MKKAHKRSKTDPMVKKESKNALQSSWYIQSQYTFIFCVEQLCKQSTNAITYAMWNGRYFLALILVSSRCNFFGVFLFLFCSNDYDNA